MSEATPGSSASPPETPPDAGSTPGAIALTAPGPGRRLGPVRRAADAIHRARDVVSTAGLMIAAWAATTILGFAFWFVASRAATPDVVGLASATIAASTLIARLTVTGLGTAMAGFLPTYPGRRPQLIATTLLVAASIGAALGVVFAVAAPSVSAEYRPLVATPSFAVLFMIGVGLAAAGVVGDQILLSLRLGRLQLWRNVVFAGSKLVLLALAFWWLGTAGAMLIFGVWALGDAVSFLSILASRRGMSGIPIAFEWRTVFGLARSAAGHHGISAMRVAPALFMPVLVTGLLSASANAAFYVALIISTALQVIASSATFTLYAVGDRAPIDFQRQLRVTLGLSSGIVAIGIVAILILGPWMLGLFGPSYVDQAAASLPWLAACAIPLVVVDHWIALRRIRQAMRGTVAILVVAAVLQVAAATIGALNGGLTGLSLGWLGALCLVALIMIGEVARAAMTSTPETDLVRVLPAQPVRGATTTGPVDDPVERLLPGARTGLAAPTTPISVFIPIRNDTAWLRGAIESVIAQTYPHWELVVGDNASTEDVAAVVAEYDDPRIRYHRFEHGVSILENWNRTALLTRHRWVQSLAADDRIRPTCLWRLAEAIEWYGPRVPRLAMVLSSCRRVYPDGTSADRIWYGSKPKLSVEDRAYDPKAWLAVCTADGQPPWQVGSMVLDCDVLAESGGMFRPEIGLSADFETAMRVGAYGHVGYVTDELLDYTVRDDADGPQRLVFNRARGVGDTVVGLALQNALHVHEEVRGLTSAERQRLFDAISRTHLQRAAQHRVLALGKGRAGALRDVARAIRWSPLVVLRPGGLAFAIGSVVAPRWLLERAKDRLTTRLHAPVTDQAPPVLAADDG